MKPVQSDREPCLSTSTCSISHLSILFHSIGSRSVWVSRFYFLDKIFVWKLSLLYNVLMAVLTSGGDVAVLQLKVTGSGGEFYNHADHFGHTWTLRVCAAEQGNCVCLSKLQYQRYPVYLCSLTSWKQQIARSKSWLKIVCLIKLQTDWHLISQVKIIRFCSLFLS